MPLRVKGASPERFARFLPFSNVPDRWLVGLRWVALSGMVTTTLVATRLVPALDTRPLLAVFALLGISNLGWMIAVLRPNLRAGSTLLLQILVDVLILVAVLWYSGGLQNPCTSFLAFQIVLAGLLATRRETTVVLVVSVALAPVLWWAPPLPLGSAPLGATVVLRVGQAFAVTALALVLGSFVVMWASRTEILRRRAGKAERLADAARLTATIGHELNTPLATILIAGKDLASEEGPPLELAEVRDLGRTVVGQARRASDVIGLFRGHVNVGRASERVDLGATLPALVSDELERLRFSGERQVEVPARLEVTVIQAALGQILANLLRNAVDALGGRAGARIDVKASVAGSRVRITVCDNGPGVAPEVLDRIGEPFETTKADRGGTGLGLYASSLLAERMGGSLELESVRGGGTCVTLLVARESADAQDQDQPDRG